MSGDGVPHTALELRFNPPAFVLKKAAACRCLTSDDWPAAAMPAAAKPIKPDPEPGLAVSVDALAWVYVWPEADAQ